MEKMVLIGLAVVGVIAVAALALTYKHASLGTKDGAHNDLADKRKLW